MTKDLPHSMPRSPERDALVRQAELIISNVLRGGVITSGIVILAGTVAFYTRYLGQNGRAATTSFPHSIAAVAHGLRAGDPVSIIALGLLLLLLTPVLRVAVSIVAFALEHDWRYVVITTIVLLILIASFLLGKGGA